ncbi:MAG: type II methionyl aminopeptidase, partial [Phototrophicales bacterium]
MDKQYVENAKTAGRIAAEALQYGASLIKPGASYHDVYAKIVDFIVDRGGFPAFPPQMSFDATAAHFMTSPTKDHVFSSEIVKLDVGVAVNGVIGDNALTIDLSGKYGDLVLASREAIELVRKRVRVGLTLGEIGALIEDAIGERGFVPVRNLSGHGLGSYVIHTSPTVPNYDNGDSSPIVSGMHFACEPFATDGIGLIGEVGTAEIYSYSAGGPV